MVNDDSVGTSLVTQWLRCHTPSAGGSGLIPGQGFPVAQTVKRLPAMWETQVQSLGREGPLEKEMATLSSILACNPTDGETWWATNDSATKQHQ